jgi:hypothetical protein
MFAVTRHGVTRYVDAVVMEEAAFYCPRLAQALGWETASSTRKARRLTREDGRAPGDSDPRDSDLDDPEHQQEEAS